MTAFFGFPRDGHAYSADEVGAALAGLIRRDSNGLPVPGVLGQLSVGAVPASWKVEVSPFTYVAAVGSGVQLTGLSAAEQVDIVPATGIPAGQGRIDVVAWDAAADQLLVVEGTAAASPLVPSTSGYVPLAQVRVNSGDGTVVAARVTAAYVSTGLAGGDRKAQGVVSKRSVVSGGVTNVNVTFPPGLFTEIPVVQATAWGDARDTGAQVDSITTSGFILRLGSTASRARSIGAQWRAEQM